MSFTVSALNPSRVDEAAEVEKLCLETAWSGGQIGESLQNGNAVYLIAEENAAVCGVACAYTVCDEAQLINLAVLPGHRRKGIAQALLTRMFEICVNRDAKLMTLEVDAENSGAICLYKQLGFSETGKRRGFYRGRDAIIMEKKL